MEYLGSVDAMASRYLAEIRKVRPEGPYYLGGVCVGCMVAFEMARRLEAEGETIAFVGVFDTQAGGQETTGIDFSSMEAAVAEELGIPIVVSKLLALAPHGRLEYLVKEGRRSQALPPGFTTADARRYIDVFKLNFLAWHQHRLTPCGVRVALFRTPADAVPGDPTWGWEEYAGGGCDLYDVPGDHASMLRSPYVEVLAERLQEALDAADARMGGSDGG
jgi:thioesterase domain-containing protein